MTRWPARLAPPVIATDTVARSFWQSRAGMRDPPDLVDLAQFARELRATTPDEAQSSGAQDKANEMDQNARLTLLASAHASIVHPSGTVGTIDRSGSPWWRNNTGPITD